jgi:hypothetical protein
MIHSEDEFDTYAINNYRNPNCISVLEYLEDLNKIKYIKRLINKYAEKNELRERLVLNHIIFLSNVFGVEATVNMLTFKIEEKNKHILNSFLIFLGYIRNTSEILHDDTLLKEVQKRVWQT